MSLMADKRRELSTELLWPLVAIAGAFILLATHPVRPHDFWWHLRAGEEILSTRSIPTSDTFSHTMAGTPYDNYASFWLVEFTYSILYRLGRLPLIIMVHSLVVTAAQAALLFLSRRVAGSWRAAASGTFLAMVLAFDNWNVRPQGVAYLFFALCLCAIWEYRQQPRWWLLAVPPVTIAIWANCHGSFFLGFVLLGIWLADSVWSTSWLVFRSRFQADVSARSALTAARAPLMLLLISLAAALLNPRGLRIFSYITSISGNSVIRSMVLEWRPPGFDSWGGALFLAALLSLAILFAVSPRRPGVFALLTYVVFGIFALAASRNVVWFGMALAPVVAEHLAALADSIRNLQGSGADLQARGAGNSREKLRFVNWTIASILLLASLMSLPWFKGALPLAAQKRGLISTETPVRATQELLDRDLPREIFNEMGFGSYLIWAARDVPVYVDTRIELYTENLWLEYLGISSAQPGWENRLKARGVNTLLLNPETQSALLASARASPDWRVVWEDAYSVLLTRKEQH